MVSSESCGLLKGRKSAPDETRLTDIVVSGHHITFSFTVPPWMGSEANGPLPGNELEIDPGDGRAECLPTEGMTDAQKLQTLLHFALAIWRLELKQVNVQSSEYGSFMYISSSGQIKWTDLRGTGSQAANIGWQDLPKLANGLPDYGSVIAVVHSHPRFNLGPAGPSTDYFDPSDPLRLTRPSLPYLSYSGIPMDGDWAIFDYVNSQAGQQQAYGGAGPRADLSIVIVGFDGSDYSINQYGASDYGYGSLDYGTGNSAGASDGLAGSRGSVSVEIYPPCSD